MSNSGTAGNGPAKVVFPAIRTAGAGTDPDGYTHGHAAGYAAGLRAAAVEQRRVLAEQRAALETQARAGRERLDAAAGLFRTAAAALERINAATVRDAENALLATSLDLAEALLGYELAAGDRTARAALDRALAGSDAGTVARIRLHPDDAAVLTGHPSVTATGIELVPDPALGRGDAVAEYPHGWLDARLDAALQRARAALLADGA